MKPLFLVVTTLFVSVVCAPLLVKMPIKIIYNPTNSAPKGYYLVQETTPKVGDYVLSNLSVEVKILAAERLYLPIKIPILKPIAAGYGEHVCVKNAQIFINGKAVARLLGRDSKGRILSPWMGCRSLREDELLLLSTYSPYSFDSRYFGPVTRKMIIGKAVPLWVF